MKIDIPVVVGKRERLIKSTPTELELNEHFLVLRKKFIKEEPKDFDDDYSVVKEVRYECVASIKKSHISQIYYMFNVDSGVYSVEVAIGGEPAYGVWVENKDSAAELYDKLMSWWILP